MREVTGRSFAEFLGSLVTTPANELHLREDFAFCGTNLIPNELRPGLRQFTKEWDERFGVKKTIHGIKKPGWYNLTVGACEVEGVRECVVYTSFSGTLALVRGQWEETFPGHGSEAQLLVLVHIDKEGAGNNGNLRSITLSQSAKAGAPFGNGPLVDFNRRERL